MDGLNRRVGQAASWLIVAVMFVMMYEVIARYAFNAPTSWAQEMSLFLYSAHFLLGMGYTEACRGHVNVDLFYSKFGPRTRALIDIICYLLLFGSFMTILFLKSIDMASASWRQLEHTNSSWQPPLYFIKTVLPIGIFLLLLQGFCKVIRDILFLTGGDKSAVKSWKATL